MNALKAALAGILIASSQAQNPTEVGALQPGFYRADDARFSFLGRYEAGNPKQPRFAFPGSGFEVRFSGVSLSLAIVSDSDTSALTVVIDHGDPTLKLLRKGEQVVSLATELNDGPHTVEVYKRTEAWQGVVTLLGLQVASGGRLLDPPPLPTRKLMFVGDSVTCGEGVNNNATCTPDPASPSNDAYHGYGMDLGRRLDAQVHLVCYGGRGLVRDYRGLGKSDGVLNAPEFLDLSIPSDEPANRAVWDHKKWIPDGIVVSVGTNDFNLETTVPLNGDAFVDEYLKFLKSLRGQYPNATVFATEGAIVTDPLLRRYVQDAVGRAQDSRILWVPATHYPGNGCNGHPTREQHHRIADDLEPVLRKALTW